MARDLDGAYPRAILGDLGARLEMIEFSSVAKDFAR